MCVCVCVSDSVRKNRTDGGWPIDLSATQSASAHFIYSILCSVQTHYHKPLSARQRMSRKISPPRQSVIPLLCTSFTFMRRRIGCVCVLRVCFWGLFSFICVKVYLLSLSSWVLAGIARKKVVVIFLVFIRCFTWNTMLTYFKVFIIDVYLRIVIHQSTWDEFWNLVMVLLGNPMSHHTGCSYLFAYFAYFVCVCVCVCVRERESVSV